MTVDAPEFTHHQLHGAPSGCVPPNANEDNFLSRLNKKNRVLNEARVQSYMQNWDDKERLEQDNTLDVENRRSAAQETTRAFYDIVTDFYEYGWGQSFHFARTFKNDNFDVAIARHEHYLAYKLGLKRGEFALDCGCGVGGPLREIVKLTGAHVTGLNFNEYQIDRCNMYSRALSLSHLTAFKRADFTKMPFADNTFDKAYSIEATVHAPRLEMVYGEIFRTLKPGGLFACYEWCVTDSYDPNDITQKRVIYAIEEGNSISKLYSTQECLNAARSVGFEILEDEDLAVLRNGEIPWYDTLKGSYSISQFRMTRAGRWTTDKLVQMLETVRLAPPGSRKVSQLLNMAADNLVEGGERGIFTPMYFWIGRKPMN